MSLARRMALLAWARRRNAWIAEDDYDSEFRYTGRPLAALQGLDEAGRVIYIGTFSKVLFPALRLGYMVVPAGAVDAFAAARALADRHPPGPSQALVAELLAEGHFARHVRRMRTLYSERQAALLAAARRECDRDSRRLSRRCRHASGRDGCPRARAIVKCRNAPPPPESAPRPYRPTIPVSRRARLCCWDTRPSSRLKIQEAARRLADAMIN